MSVTGFITAGGLSSRMGRDKAWLKLGDKTIIKHIIDALTPVTSNITIIANKPEYSEFGFPVYADTSQGIGPLEAIRTALVNSSTPRIILTGCDLPFVTSELFKFLIDIPSDKQAIVPLGPEGMLEPLCAVYSTEALESVARLIEGGGRKVSLLFDLIPTRFVEFDEIRHLRNSEIFFENINTPEEYQAAIERMEQVRKDSKLHL
jgi:molybdopterin-guanine dinucleotide biosynthesis protein A